MFVIGFVRGVDSDWKGEGGMRTGWGFGGVCDRSICGTKSYRAEMERA